jgi:hypothetical protein
MEETVHLPVWKESGGTIFISTPDVRRYLGVQVAISQSSEWFALNFIPAEMIMRITLFN